MYTDLARPPLAPRTLSRALVRPGGLWTAVRVLASVGSTNEYAASAALQGAPAGLVVVAEAQTAGRGRQDRAWMSPARAGLTFSVLLRPGTGPGSDGPVPLGRWGWLPLLGGVALARAVGRLGEVEARLKWPNDLLVGDGLTKVAGVLGEVRGEAVVLGVGLNVTTTRPELGALPATSLVLEDAACTDRATLLRAVLRELASLYAEWQDARGDADASGLRTAYRDLCATLGRQVRVSLPAGGLLTGEAVDVDADGRLVVRPGSDPTGGAAVGTAVAVAAGDVVHVR